MNFRHQEVHSEVWVMNTTQREVVCVTRVTRVVPGDAVTLIKAVFETVS